jgi:3-methyladenine DNA glycosylase AlkD
MNKNILKEIYSHRDKNRAKSSAWYFKTGKGEYGEGDKFMGISCPKMRNIAKKYIDISLKEIEHLLKSKWHEQRQIGLFILSYRYKKADQKTKKEIVDFYLQNTKYINNWDLVDLSAPNILGDFLFNFPPTPRIGEILLKLVRSKNLWEQRIAIISTFAFIRKGDIKWSIKIAKIFLNHEHDLIHKAVGWMLREVGKKDVKALRKFLDVNISKMPRTMLRYAIEKFPENLRLKYLKK